MSTGHPENNSPRLIADIGGTNARFALVSADARIYAEQVFRCADFPDPAAAIERYLSQIEGPHPTEGALALATPITGDRIKMTNHVWDFSLEETRRKIDLDRLLALNDFTALAMSLPYLEAGELHKVGGGEPVPHLPLALIGPGTGLGVSGLMPAGEQWIPLQGEGGHVTFSPATDREIEILRIARRHNEHVSAERLISGSLGLGSSRQVGSLYHAVATLHGVEVRPLSPAEIVEQAKNRTSPVCVEVVETFCAMLGTAAGNLALTLGARGGVFIGGGIIPRLGEFFDNSPFRERFEQKGRFSKYLAEVPSYVIKAKHPALIGSARAFDASLAGFYETRRSAEIDISL